MLGEGQLGAQFRNVTGRELETDGQPQRVDRETVADGGSTEAFGDTNEAKAGGHVGAWG